MFTFPRCCLDSCEQLCLLTPVVRSWGAWRAPVYVPRPPHTPILLCSFVASWICSTQYSRLRFKMISSNFSDVYDLCTTTYNVTPILPGKALSPPQLSLLSTLSLAAKSLDTPQILLPIIESPNAQWTLLSLILLATPFVLVYITTYLSYTAQVSSNEPIKSPPTVPYITPFLGSAVDFVLNPKKYVTGMK